MTLGVFFIYLLPKFLINLNKQKMKRIFFLIAASLISVALSAQIKQTNENLNDATLPCDLISDYKRAKEFTLSYLETMPEEYYNFQPTPKIINFKYEAIHLGLVNYS